MDEREFEKQVQEIRLQADKLAALPDLLKDLEQQSVNMKEAENRMRDTVRNAARLVNGILVVLESLQREQMQLRYSLLENTGELKKRLDLYSEETVRRLSSAEHMQAEGIRKMQESHVVWSQRFEKKWEEDRKKTRRSLRAGITLTVLFGGAAVALLLLFRFFL